MEFEIKRRLSGKVLFSLETKSLKLCVEAAVKSRANLSGANLYGADLYRADLSGADLSRANLSRADLYRADLYGADLSGADLSRANLSRADLYRADLYGADLSGADLSRANLSGAKGINYFLCTPLSILKDQIGKIRAYKLVTDKYTGPYYPGLTYKIGKTYSVKNACENESRKCAEGISLATLNWCIKEWKKGYKILVAEFTSKDIAAIPMATDGKFRVKRCEIIREKNLKNLGLE